MESRLLVGEEPRTVRTCLGPGQRLGRLLGTILTTEVTKAHEEEGPVHEGEEGGTPWQAMARQPHGPRGLSLEVSPG